MNQGLQPLESSKLTARAEARAPYGDELVAGLSKRRRSLVGAVVVASLRFSNANALSSLTAQAGACSSSAYAAISKIIALQAIVHRELCIVHF